MATAVGFKQLTIRVLDGASAVNDKNLFVIKGDDNKGATSSAKISGLAVDPVKTYGSNKVYKISGQGVGDGKIEFDIIDIPQAVANAVLGYTADASGVVKVTADTKAPNCAVLLEDTTPAGDAILLGFTSGVFSYDGTEWDTTEGKASEIKPETLSYAIASNDDGVYYEKYAGSDAAAITKIKADLKVTIGV